MCTAISFKTKDSYFGRNLDLEYSYKETVTVTPRKYPLHFRRKDSIISHYAMIGMAYVMDDYPLYYDAVNEHGLAMAGLNFPDNAIYYGEISGKDNITPFEFIPWILSQCKDISETNELLDNINLIDLPFSDKLPLSPLHWIISDKDKSIVIETMSDGMKIYDNPVGVLTNNPTFDFMMQNLSHYRDLSCGKSVNRFSDEIELPEYCVGLSGVGLPGDFSSVSRFIKASFVKLNSVSENDESSSVSQFFHILSSVSMPGGCVKLGADIYDTTVYSSCMNQNSGIYYYTTYNNSQIIGVDMYNENLEAFNLFSYSLKKEQNIYIQN